jgi:alpha-glucosidase (family GH31 glycosyl hydrolase)
MLNPMMLKATIDQRREVNLLGASELRLAAGETLVIDLRAGGHWYGHGFGHVQPYPLETGEIVNPAFAVNNIQCPTWMCSAGYVLFAETMAPLAVRINEGGNGRLELSCPSAPLCVRVFRGDSLREAHQQWMKYVGWPNQPPPASLFGDSLFCSWTQYPRCISQQRIVDMAAQIRRHDYPCHTLLIDDRWETCFGELAFSPHDFPDPAAMFAELQRMDFEAWLWVTPFVNVEAAGFAELASRRILVHRRDGNGAALLKWWGGTAGLVDVTFPDGRDWYRRKLQKLLDLGASGFKIDGGDHKYHPATAECAWHKDPGASGYSDVLLGLFEELTPNRCETRTAWRSQGRPILWREGGKDSHWGLDNGLKAMISLGQHLGLLGYDLLIPDMVPGRVQTLNSAHPLPTDELMVRWTEASAFFPFLQFSYFPWNYATQTEQVILGYAHAHKSLQGYLSEQAQDRQTPLLRPLWYDQPAQSELYAVADAFLLGSDLLVAPIVEPGAISRDIPLPAGDWIDAWSGTLVRGALRTWPAPCPGIPLFIRAGKAERLSPLREALSHIRRGCIASGTTTTTWQAGLDRDLSVSG